MTEYITKLTEQQYRSNYGRLESYSKILRQKLNNNEITKKEYVDKIFNFTDKMGILIDNKSENVSETNPDGKTVIQPDEIFGYKKEPEIDPSIHGYMSRKEKFYEEKDSSVSLPKTFVTTVERNAPCKIVYNPNVKQLMLGTVDYSDKVRREAHYTLCETPEGIKTSSPSFGKWGQVSRRIERTQNKCIHEFGKDSKEVGEFHTHPQYNADEFSPGDLLSFKDDPYNYNNSNCVVTKTLDKDGIKGVRVRCTTGLDAKRFLDSVNIVSENYQDYINRLGNTFYRDPKIQNAFSCVVDFDTESINNKKLTSKRQIKKIQQIKSSKIQQPKINRVQQKQIKKEILKKAKKEVRKNNGDFDFGEGFNL